MLATQIFFPSASVDSYTKGHGASERWCVRSNRSFPRFTVVSSNALAAATSGGPHLLELVSRTDPGHQYGVEHFEGSDETGSDWIRGPIPGAMQPILGAVASVNPHSHRESGDMDMHWPLLHLLESCGDHGDHACYTRCIQCDVRPVVADLSEPTPEALSIFYHQLGTY